MAAGLHIRPARADELAICAEIYVRVLRDTFTWMAPARHKAEDFLRYARDEEIYVAVDDGGEILGLAGFYRPQNFLHSLYVTARGRGVGKALLDHVEDVADGPLTLKVQTPNARARDFYAREGFEVLDEGQDGDIAWQRLARS